VKIEDSYLNEVTRASNLRAIGAASHADPLDILIAGGGVTGLGAALDAAARGLRVGLVEKGDYASGTSGASSRLAHGGLRYLEQGHIRLVREALRERHLLVTALAPHLAYRHDFLFPARTGLQLPYFRAGVAAYDLLAQVGGGRLKGSPSRMIRRNELQRIAPGLNTRDMSGAIQFADAQIDDARHTMVLARTAQAHGALVSNYAQLNTVSDREAGVIRCSVEADGTEVTTWTRSVLIACGAWTNTLARPIGHRSYVRPSKGTHIVVPKSSIDLQHAVLSRTKDSVLFILPWMQTWIIGTTDDDYRDSLDSVHADDTDISYLIDQANKILRDPITESDITATFAGLRPLPAKAKASKTARVSREHVIDEVKPGVFTIFGGKYTTYRIMAKDAIDSACVALGRPRLPCTTDRIPLIGAPNSLGAASDAARHSALEEGADTEAYLAARYGTEAASIADTAKDRPEALTRIDPQHSYLCLDIEQAVQREGARTVDDVLQRRLRLATQNASAAERSRPVIRQVAKACGVTLQESPRLSAGLTE